MNKTEKPSYIHPNTSFSGKDKIPFYCRSIGHRMADEKYRSKLTSHYFYEFIWTIEGGGSIEFQRKKLDLRPNEIFIIPPDIQRVFYTNGVKWHFRWFTITGDFFGELVKSFNLPFLESKSLGCSLTSDFVKLETDLKESFSTNTNEAAETVFRILNKSAGKGLALEKKSRLVTEALALMEKNIALKELNVDWISEKLKCDRSHFSRLFKKESGMSPSEHITMKRLQMAADFLKNKNEKIYEIADLCGFADPDYFSRSFKKRTGMSPGEFRKDETP